MMRNQRRIQEYHDILHSVVTAECPVPMDRPDSIAAKASHDTLAWVLGFPCGAVIEENVSYILTWASNNGYELVKYGDTGTTHGS